MSHDLLSVGAAARCKNCYVCCLVHSGAKVGRLNEGFEQFNGIQLKSVNYLIGNNLHNPISCFTVP